MDAVDVIIVKKLTSEVSRLYSLPPLTAAEHPMAYNEYDQGYFGYVRLHVSFPLIH
jgi:hypothetical protein